MAAAVPPLNDTPSTFGGLLSGARQFAVRDLPRTIVFALAGAAFAYVANVLLMARKYQGTNVVSGSPVSVDRGPSTLKMAPSATSAPTASMIVGAAQAPVT